MISKENINKMHKNNYKSGKIKVTVVIATYNGARYIERQLDSLYRQKKIPDEVLIGDDCSTDNTVEIIEKFIHDHHLKNWILSVNSHNMGWKKNFFTQIFKATGDYIFYCDQDDIWYENKILIMSDILEKNYSINCLFCNYDYIDWEDKKLQIGKKLGDSKQVYQIEIQNINYFYPPHGCGYVFKRDILDYIDKHYMDNKDCGGTDRVICQTAMLLNSFYTYDAILFGHRIHDKNTGGESIDGMTSMQYGSDTLEHRKKNFHMDKDLFTYVSEFGGFNNTQLQNIKYIKRVLFLRYKLLYEKNFLAFIRLLVICNDNAVRRYVCGDCIYVFGMSGLVKKILQLRNYVSKN